MVDLLVKILINAIAVYVAVLVVPQINFPAADDLLKVQGNWWHVIVVALILALILNALLLLLVAFLADYLDINFTIGGFPPNFTADSFVGALLGSIVISIVSIVLGMLDRGRRIVA